jgi:peptide/nickel transport system permease protein
VKRGAFAPAVVLSRGFAAIAVLRESRVAAIGAVVIAVWATVAALAPFLAPFDPNATLRPFALPGDPAIGGGTFWLGTDAIGRDILSRIIWGSRTVFLYAPTATAAAYLVGVAAGLAAGYYRGLIDEVLSFLANVVLAFPVLVLFILIITSIGASGLNIIVAIVFAGAPGIMRIVRGLVLDIRERDFIAAAEIRGEASWYILLIEILPNIRMPLIVDACLRLGYVIVTIGVLGFLGLGLPPPDPDWGGMISEARPVMLAFPHIAVFPGIAISSLVLGCNLLADGLREISGTL